MVYYVTDILFVWAGFCRPGWSISLSSVYLCDEMNSQQLLDALAVAVVWGRARLVEELIGSLYMKVLRLRLGPDPRLPAVEVYSLFFIHSRQAELWFLCSNHFIQTRCHRAVRSKLYCHEIYKIHLSLLHTFCFLCYCVLVSDAVCHFWECVRTMWCLSPPRMLFKK